MNKNTDKWLWNAAIEITFDDEDFFPSIVASPCGKFLYVSGNFRGQAKFRNVKCNTVDTEVAFSSVDFGENYSHFVAKMTVCGTWLWVTSLDTNGEAKRTYITVDNCGDVIILINIEDSTEYKFYNVGNTTNTTPALTSSSLEEDFILVAKLNHCGQWQWLAYVMSEDERVQVSGQGRPLAIDYCNNIIVSGDDAEDEVIFFYESNSDGSIKEDYKLKGIEPANDQMFVAKMNSCGKWLWVAGVDSNSNEDTPAVVVDKCNNIYLAGDGGNSNNKMNFYHAGPDGNTTLLDPLLGLKSEYDHVFIGKLNPCGRWIWTAAVQSSYSGNGCYDPCIALDNCGDLLISCTGFYGGQPVFYNTGLKGNTDEKIVMLGKKSRDNVGNDGPQSTTQVSVSKLSPCGKWIWNASMDSRYNFDDSQIRTDSCGNAYVVATHSNITNFPGLIGLYDSYDCKTVYETPSVVGNGWLNTKISVAKIDKCGRWQSIYSVDSDYVISPALAVDRCNNAYVAATTRIIQNENDPNYNTVNFYQGTNIVPAMTGLKIADEVGLIIIGKIGKC